MLAPLIPPSIAFVIWGIIAQQSIARLFISGILPGLAIAFGLHVICYVHARRHGIPIQARAIWPMVVVVLIVLMLTTCLPGFALALQGK